MKVKARLTRLTNGQAKFISLVHRSASQIPFRILKADHTPAVPPVPKEAHMLDLSTLKIAPHTAATPETARKSDPSADDRQIVAVVIHKSANLDTIKKALTDAGMSTEGYELSEDGQHVFHQTPAGTEPTTIIKHSDQMALIVKGFDAYKGSTASFKDSWAWLWASITRWRLSVSPRSTARIATS